MFNNKKDEGLYIHPLPFVKGELERDLKARPRGVTTPCIPLSSQGLCIKSKHVTVILTPMKIGGRIRFNHVRHGFFVA
jgi:hypothetical protein